MADVVLQLPVGVGEDLLFGQYLDAFIQSRFSEVERLAASSDAPYVMVRSDPAVGEAIRILTFQEGAAAREFSSGWGEARARAGRRA